MSDSQTGSRALVVASHYDQSASYDRRGSDRRGDRHRRHRTRHTSPDYHGRHQSRARSRSDSESVRSISRGRDSRYRRKHHSHCCRPRRNYHYHTRRDRYDGRRRHHRHHRSRDRYESDSESSSTVSFDSTRERKRRSRRLREESRPRLISRGEPKPSQDNTDLRDIKPKEGKPPRFMTTDEHAVLKKTDEDAPVRSSGKENIPLTVTRHDPRQRTKVDPAVEEKAAVPDVIVPVVVAAVSSDDSHADGGALLRPSQTLVKSSLTAARLPSGSSRLYDIADLPDPDPRKTNGITRNSTSAPTYRQSPALAKEQKPQPGVLCREIAQVSIADSPPAQNSPKLTAFPRIVNIASMPSNGTRKFTTEPKELSDGQSRKRDTPGALWADPLIDQWRGGVEPPTIQVDDLAAFTKQIAGCADCDLEPTAGVLLPPVDTPPTQKNPLDELAHKQHETAEERIASKTLNASGHSEVALNTTSKMKLDLQPSIACHLRPAKEKDMAEALDIYNAEVRHGNQARDSEVVSLSDFRTILLTCQNAKLPFIVAVAGSSHDIRPPARSPQQSDLPQKGKILGFCLLQQHHRGICGEVVDSAGSNKTRAVKMTTFVDWRYRGKLIGFALMDKMLQIVCKDYVYNDICEFYDEYQAAVFRGPQHFDHRIDAVYVEVLRAGTDDPILTRFKSLLERSLGFELVGILTKSQNIGGRDHDLITYRRKICKPDSKTDAA